MKTKISDLESLIARRPLKAFFVFGDDYGKRLEVVTEIQKHFTKKIKQNLEILKYTSAEVIKNPLKLKQDLTSPSFLGNEILVIIDGFSESLLPLLEPFIEHFLYPVVIVTEQVASTSKFRQFFEKSGHTSTIACYADTQEDLEKLVYNTAKAFQLKIDENCRSYLVASLSPDYGLARQELTAFCESFEKGSTVHENDLLKLQTSEQGFKLDQIFYHFHQPNSGFYIHLKGALNKDPSALLRGFQKHIERLITAHLKLKQGLPFEGVIKSFKPPVLFLFHKVFEKQVKSFEFAVLKKMLADLQNIELKSRSTSLDIEVYIGQNLINLMNQIKQ
jgi:DNA polymerase III subunit delta